MRHKDEIKTGQIRGVYVIPGRYSTVINVTNTLPCLSSMFEGRLVMAKPFDNKETALLFGDAPGQMLNRYINGQLYSGILFVCRVIDDNGVFGSLSGKDVNHYSNMLYYPEVFIRNKDGHLWVTRPNEKAFRPICIG